LSISDNDALTNLTGLEQLTSMDGRLWISGNDFLTSLVGLNSINDIGITDIRIFSKIL